jgi:hypothetical protein
MTKRESFRIEGQCWCPNDLKLGQLRMMGHTEECTRAREGWRINMRNLEHKRRDEEERLDSLERSMFGSGRSAI